MLFLITLVLFCYVLHNVCDEKGVSPWSYLAGYVSGWLLVFVIISVAIVCIYGANIVNDAEMQRKLLPFVPLTLLLHFFLFLVIRRKIEHLPDYISDDDDTPVPPANQKKDLSYFR